MNNALNTIYYIFNKLITFIFDTAEISTNVTVGWIMVVVVIFSMTIASILNLPRRMGSFDRFREHTYVTNTTKSDGSKTWTERRTFRR